MPRRRDLAGPIGKILSRREAYSHEMPRKVRISLDCHHVKGEGSPRQYCQLWEDSGQAAPADNAP
jgi:hypothetical protein